MEPLEIVNRIKEKFLSEVVEMKEFRGQVSLSLKREKLLEICRYLHDDPDIHMDYLADLCGVDYPDHKYRFEVVYSLFSMKHKHRLLIKALLPEDDPTVESVVPVWNGANWHEREAYDLLGIAFSGHPNLERILTSDNFSHHPLRKDFPVEGNPEEHIKYR